MWCFFSILLPLTCKSYSPVHINTSYTVTYGILVEYALLYAEYTHVVVASIHDISTKSKEFKYQVKNKMLQSQEANTL